MKFEQLYYNSVVLDDLDKLIGGQDFYYVTKIKLSNCEVMSLTGFTWNDILTKQKMLYYNNIPIVPRFD